MAITPEQARQELARRNTLRQQSTTSDSIPNSPFNVLKDVPGIIGSYLNARTGFLPGMTSGFISPSVEAAGSFAHQHQPEFEQMGGVFGKAAVPILEAQGALAGGINRFLNPSPQTVAGKIGTGAATATGVVQSLLPLAESTLGHVGRGFKRILSNRAGSEMAEQTQQAFLRARRVSNAGYGAQLKVIEASNPSKFVSLPTEANELLKATSNPRTAQLVEYAGRASGSPILEDLLTNPGRKLTLSEAQEVKEAINSIPGFASKLRNPATAQWDVTELPLVRFATQVGKATDEAFPEKVALDTLHATRKGQERLVSFLGKPRSYSRGGAPRLSSGLFRSTSPQVAQAYESVLPAGIRKEISGVHTAKNITAAGILGAASKRILPPFLNRLLFYRTEQ